MINKKIIALTNISTLFESDIDTGECIVETLTLNQLWEIITGFTHNDKDKGDLVEATYNKWREKIFVLTKDNRYISDFMDAALHR